MRKTVFLLLILGAVSVLGSPAHANIEGLWEPGFSNTVNFDKLQNGTAISDNLESRGIRFRDQLSAYTQAKGEAPATIENSSSLSKPISLHVTNDGKGVFVLFQNPVRSVGARLLCDHRGGAVLLEAYDTNMESLGAFSLGALDDVWQFLGFKCTEDVAAVRFYRQNPDKSQLGFRIDDLGFSPGAGGSVSQK